jgi:hypothetical protein
MQQEEDLHREKQSSGALAARFKGIKRNLLRGSQFVKEKVGIAHEERDEEYEMLEKDCNLLELKATNFATHVSKMAATLGSFEKQYHAVMGDFQNVLGYGDENQHAIIISTRLMNAANGE